MSVINPKKIVSEWVLTIENQDQIQQNGIDLTIWEIFTILPWLNILTKNERKHTCRDPIEFDQDWYTILSPWCYDILFAEKINLPNWICSYVVSRSTLNRWWNFITSWWYDAWFNGPMWWVLHVTQWSLKIQKWVRIAQMIFLSAEEWDLYEWIYNWKTIA